MQKEDKFEVWFEKVAKGVEGFEIVYSDKGELIWRAEGSKADIISCYIIIWTKNEVSFSYSWNKGCDYSEDKHICFIIRNQKKIIFEVGDKNYSIFGFKEDVDRDENIMIFYQLENFGSFLVASTNTPEIRLEIYRKNQETDAMKVFVEQIYSSLIKTPSLEGEESENE